jgi:hypothetical protein
VEEGLRLKVTFNILTCNDGYGYLGRDVILALVPVVKTHIWERGVWVGQLGHSGVLFTSTLSHNV